MSWRQLAEREGIHTRAMRGVMKGYWLDHTTYMRLLYGIEKTSTANFIKWIKACKKDRKYTKYVKAK